MKPLGGIGSETGEDVGLEPARESVRGVMSKTRSRGFFTPRFFFGAIFLFESGLNIAGAELARYVKRRQDAGWTFINGLAMPNSFAANR